MWKHTPINPFNYIEVYGFNDIVAIANSMKSCHVFQACNDGFLYGAPEEGYTLYAIRLPAELVPQVPVSFRYDSLNLDIIGTYKNFRYFYDSLNWILIPMDLDMSSIVGYTQVYSSGTWDIVTTVPETSAVYTPLYIPDSDKSVYLGYMHRLIYNKRCISDAMASKESYVFTDMQNHPTVQEVVQNKISKGRKYLELVTADGKKYGMFIFKNLVNLNKSDKLDIIIRDRIDNPKTFEVEFVITKKINPVKHLIQPHEVHGYAQFLHI